MTTGMFIDRLRRLPGVRRRRVRVWAMLVASIAGVLLLQAVFPDLRILPDTVQNVSSLMILTLFLMALVCEFVDSTLGMGYGTTLTPMLLLLGFDPLQVVPCVLCSECLTGLAAGLMHHRDGNVDLLRDRRARGTVLLLSVLSVVGAVAAVTLALRLPTFWLKLFIALMILSIGVLILATIRHRIRYRRGHIIALGAIAAFNKGISGGGYGPLVTSGQVVSGLPAKHAVAITSLAESLTCVVGLIAYLALQGSIDLSLAVPLTIGALLSVPVATLTVRRLPERAMKAGVGVTTCILGALALAKLLM